MHDILTDFRKVELALQRLTLIAEQVSEGVAVIDLDGRIRFANAAMAEMHGYSSKKDLIDKTISVFHTADQMNTDVSLMIAEVRHRGRLSGTIEHLRIDGSVFPTQTKMILLTDADDEPAGFAVFVTDITERMYVKEQLRHHVTKLEQAEQAINEKVAQIRQLEDMTSEYSQDTYEQQSPAFDRRPVLNEEKFRSLAELAKRLAN